ncbi:MAG: GntR family transcriptional regulator/MocR family aminotransferase [Oceanospirillaceae bacterium]|jgi:GntR family transcriptional regulator/MocR family aminotransferase
MAKSKGGSLLSSIKLKKTKSQSLQYQLYSKLRDMILNGSLAGGERLPASRVLALELEISRTTVINVFDRLISEGLVESKTGSGSFVKDVFYQQQQLLKSARRKSKKTNSEVFELDQSIAGTSSSALQRPKVSQSFLKKAQQLPMPISHSVQQSFSTAIPAIDSFPLPVWARLVAKHSRLPNLTRYNSSKGSHALRQAISSHLHADRGMVCDAEQIYITSGAHQAFSFLAQLLIDPGDKVWIENPGSRVARNGLLQSEPVLIPVPVDNEGFDVESAQKLSADFKVATVTPSHQQPRGVLLSLARRLALLKAADQANAWVIEDDYDGELFYHHEPLPTLFSLSQAQRVITVGTFSKTIFPALRLGYFVVPKHLVNSIDNAINSFLPAVPLPIQAALAEFIKAGHFATHIRRSKKLYLERYQAITHVIERDLNEYLAPIPTSTGFHLLALFKQSHCEQGIADRALLENILVRQLNNYCCEAVSEKGIVLGFGCITPEQIDVSIKKLATVFQRELII